MLTVRGRRLQRIDILVCEQMKNINALCLRGEPIDAGAVHFIWRVER